MPRTHARGAACRFSFRTPPSTVFAAPRHIPARPILTPLSCVRTVEPESSDERLNNYSSLETAHFIAFRPPGCGKSGSDENHNNYSSLETAHFNDFRPSGFVFARESESEPSFPQSYDSGYVPFLTPCKRGCLKLCRCASRLRSSGSPSTSCIP